MMKIEKVINNNQIICIDHNGKECIAVGKGIGFKAVVGDDVVSDNIEKFFSIVDPLTRSRFQELVSSIPFEHIRVTDEIIRYVKVSLGKPVSDNIYVTLTDHLNFAIERFKAGNLLSNPLLWEIKRFYHHEYQLGQYALDYVYTQLGIRLPEDEAGFIALHIVNAETSGSIEQTVKMTHLIQGVLNIIKYYFQLEFNEQGLDYNRFLTHLRFFTQRLMTKETYGNKDDGFYQMLRQEYRQEYDCAEKVKSYIAREYCYQMNEEETLYLVVHINRLISAETH